MFSEAIRPTLRNGGIAAYPRKMGSSTLLPVTAAHGRTRHRSLERVERICGEHSDDRVLRTSILSELGTEVPFDWYAWLLTDPQTEVGSAPMARVPSIPDLPRLIRAKYLAVVNRWTGVRLSVTSLHGATGGVLHRSDLWRDVLSGYGVADVASLVFRDTHGCWSWLDLWRGTELGQFDDDELRYLADIVEMVTRGLRGAVARTFDEESGEPIEGDGPLVLVLSPQLQVMAQTPDTEAYLRTLIPPVGDRNAIPAAAYNVAAQVLAAEAGIDSHQPSARVHLHGGVWLSVRATRIDSSAALAERDIAVSIEKASTAMRRDLFTRSHALSPRETEVVERISQGADTRTIAEALFVSENTVQDHLKSIFAKTGARNRRTILARIAGR